MAELVTAAVVAEEVVSNSVYVGAAGYAVAQPTMPLKATFTQTATAGDASALARSHHTVNVIGSKAFLFGGELGSGRLAGNELVSVALQPADTLHAEHSTSEARPAADGGAVPPPRSGHAACARNSRLYVFGGCDASGAPIDEGAAVWCWDEVKATWESLKAEAKAEGSLDLEPDARHGHSMFAVDADRLIVHGGQATDGTHLKDTWLFHIPLQLWEPLVEAPVSSANAAFADGTLYLIAGEDSMSGVLHSLQLATADTKTTPTWQTAAFPTNPLTPGPRPRTGAGLLPVTTGYGRQYLLYFFGVRQGPQAASASAKPGDAPPEQWSDIWTYQLPSATPAVRPTTRLADAIKPAAIKDAIRTTLGYDSGGHSWAEVDVQTPEVMQRDGKVHPGPRGFFGADVLSDGSSVVMWGGVNAKGEREGDGWIIRLE